MINIGLDNHLFKKAIMISNITDKNILVEKALRLFIPLRLRKGLIIKKSY
jgi:hypothetical protein